MKVKHTSESQTPSQDKGVEEDASCRNLSLSHFRYGWVSLLLFLTVGIVLEGLHGFKSQWYLSVDNEVRRLMLTLGHTHGTLLSLVNIAFAASCHCLPKLAESNHRFTSLLLKLATILMPLGFILGGLVIYDGDPGPGIVLVPVGALCLLLSVLSIVAAILRIKN